MNDARITFKIIIAGHAVMARNREKDKKSHHTEAVFLGKMEEKMGEVYDSCIHCMIADGKERVPRPLGY